nr:ABC transporter permease [bacterium]
MSNTGVIFRREFGAYFNSPIAYIFIIVFLIL